MDNLRPRETQTLLKLTFSITNKNFLLFVILKFGQTLFWNYCILNKVDREKSNWFRPKTNYGYDRNDFLKKKNFYFFFKLKINCGLENFNRLKI